MSVPNAPYPEIARERIKSTLLIDKLQNHILEGESHPMTKTQVSAAIALLKKTVPDLQSIEATHKGDAANPNRRYSHGQQAMSCPHPLEYRLSTTDCVTTWKTCGKCGQRLTVTYEFQHRSLVDYLLAKVHEEDWHGVSDAANDLRVLEAKGKL